MQAEQGQGNPGGPRGKLWGRLAGSNPSSTLDSLGDVSKNTFSHTHLCLHKPVSKNAVLP